MSEDPSEPSKHDISPQQDMGLMLQKRALHQLERANQKPFRSPKRIVLGSLAAAMMIFLLLLAIDKGVKVIYRVIDIWMPIILDTKKAPLPKPQSTTNVDKPYMIKVEPATQQSSASSQSSTQ